jgi:hypothetical protein
VPIITSASVFSGYVAAKSAESGPPSETPTSAACLDPTASITARTSSMRCSSEGSSLSETRSERPVPRLSNRMSRENDARRERNRAKSMFFQKYSRCETQPITKTRSIGPSPTTW